MAGIVTGDATDHGALQAAFCMGRRYGHECECRGGENGGLGFHDAMSHVLGAIAGCAYGRYRANEQDREQDQQRQTRAPAGQEKL